MTQRIITGITSSGTPHLGNYVGAIKPAIEASLAPHTECYYFIADYHSLVKLWDPTARAQYIREISATWLALGLNPEKVFLYRQSDIPEIGELYWILTTLAAKGLLNRAHAYKALVAENLAKGDKDPDAAITMGLFCYPVLMAADILIANAHKVPVGKDQIQHIEMARDIAQRFNHVYGEAFILPEGVVDENVPTLPGLDGRKMSKSYDNTIPLFCETDALRKLINKIKTNSQLPEEPKDRNVCALFQIYQCFASPSDLLALAERYQSGIGWGEIKKILFECVDAHLSAARVEYHKLMAHPDHIDAILKRGADKMRAKAAPFLREIKQKTGL